MNSLLPDPCERLFARLEPYHQMEFTGRLTLMDSERSWSLYYKLGNFTWAAGGNHPLRRWRRQLMRCSERLHELSLGGATDDTVECWDYNALSHFLQERKLAEQQARSIVCGTVCEVLFDLVLSVANGAGPLDVEEWPNVRPTDGGLLIPCWDWSYGAALEQARVLWQGWSAANLQDASPDCALWIRKPEELRARTSDNLYEYLDRLADGRHTLRDLAARTREDFLELLRLLAPYIRKQLVDMVDVLDLSVGELPREQGSPSGVLEDLGNPLQSGHRDFPRNAMEQLVREEVQRQLRKLPPEAIANLKSIDTFTYALNRLPPLYASTQRGLQIQISRGKREFGDRIAEHVRLAILTLHNRSRSRSAPARSVEDLAIADPSGPLDFSTGRTLPAS